ncbi:hypothetical protein [Paenibacillus sp. ACRRY]|uniref:hypothetical protein n=1 Tax=Paenibacillus sp. ACRRY TaxID=2918208 RepID=UPI001EF611ED|nr:hypothetical protein [Paenibacillus sp. ACRRY]MCG7383200.1 hypothetical protein [Paenibacillus sp. ACRRY]
MNEERSAVTIEAVFTSWTEAESARRALALLHPNQLSIESLTSESFSRSAEPHERMDEAPTALTGGFSGELNVLALISDETEILSNGEVMDNTEQRASVPSKQEILLTVSVPSDYLPQAAEMITQNGGRFC